MIFFYEVVNDNVNINVNVNVNVNANANVNVNIKLIYTIEQNHLIQSNDHNCYY